MANSREKRVYAGFYKRYDGKEIYVIRVVKDIDTGEQIVICKDANYFSTGDGDYYTISKVSFCEQVEIDSQLVDKYTRRSRKAIDRNTILELLETGFDGPQRKPFTYKDDEYAARAIRSSCSYFEYAKDLCVNYRMDLRRYKLMKERGKYIGEFNKQSFAAMCEDLTFVQQLMKTVLADHREMFQKRFAEGLSVRKTAAALSINRGAVERRQLALFRDMAQQLQARDLADSVCRIVTEE